jgi:hypothetical protein
VLRPVKARSGAFQNWQSWLRSALHGLARLAVIAAVYATASAAELRLGKAIVPLGAAVSVPVNHW